MYPNNLSQLTDFVLLYLITSYICLINFYGCQNVSQYPYPFLAFFANLLCMSECVLIPIQLTDFVLLYLLCL